MRERAHGIETEYAIIYHPGPGDGHSPRKRDLYTRFERALEARVRSVRNVPDLRNLKEMLFLENGATFHYEKQPGYEKDGLLEMASPECRDPYSLLTFERAKDDLIQELAEEVTEVLRCESYSGRVRVGKNNLDAIGNTLGSHESYGFEDPLSPEELARLEPWQQGTPVLTVLLGLSPAVPVCLFALAVDPTGWMGWTLWGVALLAMITAWLRWTLLGPGLQNTIDRVYARLYRRFCFRSAQRHLPAFLATRSVFSGAGRLVLGDGPMFRLTQRAPFIRRVMGISRLGQDRAFWDARDLVRVPESVHEPRRRLHLVLGDALLCEWAQLLRVGTTSLVLEAIEAQPDRDWPALAEPVAALKQIDRDPSLTAKVELADGRVASALEIQRHYLEGVRAVLGDDEPLLWKSRVLDAWQQTLHLLEHDRSALFGRIDWITKQALLERRASAEDWRRLEDATEDPTRLPEPQDPELRRLRALAFALRRDDLRYHELSEAGGQRRLERTGRAWRVTDPDAVLRARTEPPSDTRAQARGTCIRECAGQSGLVLWDRVEADTQTWALSTDPLSDERTPTTRSLRSLMNPAMGQPTELQPHWQRRVDSMDDMQHGFMFAIFFLIWQDDALGRLIPGLDVSSWEALVNSPRASWTAAAATWIAISGAATALLIGCFGTRRARVQLGAAGASIAVLASVPALFDSWAFAAIGINCLLYAAVLGIVPARSDLPSFTARAAGVWSGWCAARALLGLGGEVLAGVPSIGYLTLAFAPLLLVAVRRTDRFPVLDTTWTFASAALLTLAFSRPEPAPPAAVIATASVCLVALLGFAAWRAIVDRASTEAAPASGAAGDDR